MNYGKLNTHDIANGEGVRVSLFVSGCRQHCGGCFNKETWDFNYGTPATITTLSKIMQALDNDFIQGLTILGGEPLEPENQRAVCVIVKHVKSCFPDKDVWMYTGKVLEELPDTETIRSILSNVDVLVDGPFIEEQKDITLRFRGSRNQRIIHNPITYLRRNRD